MWYPRENVRVIAQVILSVVRPSVGYEQEVERMLLTMKENKRLQVVQEVLAKERTVEEAARVLCRSERHVYRILDKVRKGGALGVIHGNRGREPVNKTPQELIERIIQLRSHTYTGFNDRHFRDELEDEEGVKIGRETVRKILRTSGTPPVKPARKRKYRGKRKAKDKFGEMLQGDGSWHDWLQGRGPWLTLVHFVDDATTYQWAEFFGQETTEAYFILCKRIFKKHGFPRCLYVDKDSIFKVNREDTIQEQLSGMRPMTTFERAMQELAIPIIWAHSPQAKGRVERRGGLNQDRLVSELRKAKASTLEEAREVLRVHLRKLNKRFVRKPADSESAFMPLPQGLELKQILCWKEERTVANNNTISFRGVPYQIPPSSYRTSWTKCKVAVHLCLDGSLHIFHKGQRIVYFRKTGVSWNDLPTAPLNTKALYQHSPRLTFSLGH